MNFLSPPEALGLDIGRRSVKALVMRKGKAGVEILHASLVEVESSPRQGEEEKREKTVDALNKIFSEIGRKPRRVALACPGQVVFPRLIKLPPVAKGKLKHIVQYETQQQIPFSLDDVIWDYHILPAKEKSEMRALILAVKKDIVENILSPVMQMKLEVEVLDFAPLSVFNTLYFNREILQDTPISIVDIGAQSTDITIVEGGEIVMVRPVPLGSDNLTQAIASTLGISFSEAQKLKEKEVSVILGRAPSNEREEKVSRAIQPVLEELLDEIRRSIGYYRSQLRGATIENLVLTGGGIQLKNIDNFIEENLRIKVKKINPFIRLHLPVDIFSRFPEPSIFSVALGLGLRLLGESRININLLPEPILQRVEFRKKEPILIISFVLIFLTLFIYAGIVRQKAFREEIILKNLNDTIQNYSRLDKALKPKLKEKKKLLDAISQFEKIKWQETFWLDVLNEITYLIPDGIILEKFSPLENAVKRKVKKMQKIAPILRKNIPKKISKKVPSKRGIRLEGLSPDFETISKFISHLESSPVLEKIEVDPSSGQLIKLDEKEFVKFVLVVTTCQEVF